MYGTPFNNLDGFCRFFNREVYYMNQFKLKKIIKNNLKKIRNESYFSLCYKYNEIKNSDDMVLLTILNNEINEELKKIKLVEIKKKILS